MCQKTDFLFLLYVKREHEYKRACSSNNGMGESRKAGQQFTTQLFEMLISGSAMSVKNECLWVPISSTREEGDREQEEMRKEESAEHMEGGQRIK